MCVFCDIIERKAEGHIVYESENIMAFLDIEPINEGHILIVPKMHVNSIDQIPLPIVTEIMELTQKIVVAYRELYQMDGYSMKQNGGEFCDFGHAHFHVFPRYKDDGFGWTYKESTDESSDRVAENIAEMLKYI